MSDTLRKALKLRRSQEEPQKNNEPRRGMNAPAGETMNGQKSRNARAKEGRDEQCSMGHAGADPGI
jgi:ribosomal protein L4